MPPSDTFVTYSPEWLWWVVLYFFFGGLAGGSYFIGTLINTFGTEADRPLARVAHYIALPAVILCAPLLIVDLNRPERFWHMLVQNQTWLPMFKYWSPMSVGAWALLIFGAFALVSFVGALWESGRIRWQPPKICCTNVFRIVFSIAGTLVGFFLASYTGVLLSATNRAIWADTYMIGLLFIVSAASTSAALILMLSPRSRAVTRESLRRLRSMDRWVMALELAVIVLFLVSLGAVLQAWLNGWGLVFIVGFGLLGVAIPLLLHARPAWLGSATTQVAGVLAIVGGFVMRTVVVFSAQNF